MSYAIETSKRKFERILNSISDELWKEDDRSTKRLRLSDISTRKPTSRLFRRKHPASTTSSTTAREEKAYSPFDRREFDRRLSSFRTNVSDWPPKPERINEVKWALRGWELAGKNTVACQRCSNRVTVDIEQNELGSEESEIDRERRRTETEESLIALYYDRIIDGHVGSCPWRQRGCNASLYRVRFNGFNNAITALKARFESLRPLEEALPREVGPRTDKAHDNLFNRFRRLAYHINVSLVSQTVTDSSERAEPPESNEKNDAAFVLALYGWARDPFSKSSKDVVIQCNTCFARAGLWMYERIARDGQLFTGEGLQPILQADELHYSDCPWINSKTQMAHTGDTESLPLIPAWEVLATFLRRVNEASENGGTTQDKPMDMDKATRNALDKARFERVRALTRSFNLHKSK